MIDRATIFAELTRRNAIRRQAQLPLLDMRNEFHRAVEFSRWKTVCEEHSDQMRSEVIAELRSLVAEHRFEERFWGQLMLALYRSGSQADALRCYSQLRVLLKEQLGITPGPDVSGLEQAILVQDPALAWTPPVPSPEPMAMSRLSISQ